MFGAASSRYIGQTRLTKGAPGRALPTWAEQPSRQLSGVHWTCRQHSRGGSAVSASGWNVLNVEYRLAKISLAPAAAYGALCGPAVGPPNGQGSNLGNSPLSGLGQPAGARTACVPTGWSRQPE